MCPGGKGVIVLKFLRGWNTNSAGCGRRRNSLTRTSSLTGFFRRWGHVPRNPDAPTNFANWRLQIHALPLAKKKNRVAPNPKKTKDKRKKRVIRNQKLARGSHCGRVVCASPPHASPPQKGTRWPTPRGGISPLRKGTRCGLAVKAPRRGGPGGGQDVSPRQPLRADQAPAAAP